MGGRVPLGYDLQGPQADRQSSGSQAGAGDLPRVPELGCVRKLKAHLDAKRVPSKVRISASGQRPEAESHSRGALYKLLANRIYIGEIFHKETVYPGEHKAIIDRELWERVRAKLAENQRARTTSNQCKRTPASLAGSSLTRTDLATRRLMPLRTESDIATTCRGESSMADPRLQQPRRIPARELEQLVLTELGSFFAVGRSGYRHTGSSR